MTAPHGWPRYGLRGDRRRGRAGDRLVLCVSEDPGTGETMLAPALRAGGYGVEIHKIDRRVPLDLRRKPYQLVLFDVSRMDEGAFELCAMMRAVSPLPIVLILHDAAHEDILRGYEAGADAYVVSPFDPRELLARMSALCRRSWPAARTA